MILYTLQCGQGHRFESWFASSSSFEEQQQRGFVSCPHCGSADVEKAIMAPAVARTDVVRARTQDPEPTMETQAPEPMPAPAAASALNTASPVEAGLRALLRKVRAHVEENADYVGADFARVARQMHEGEVEQRSIYGEATADEVKALHEDEVDVFPLPLLPEEQN